MKNLLITLISFISFNAFSQETITASQAKDFVGKEVFLMGKVASTKPTATTKGEPMLYLNIDKDYPDNDLVVVIFSQVLAKIRFTEKELQNKSVKVKGIISIFKEKPQIILQNEADLTIVQ